MTRPNEALLGALDLLVLRTLSSRGALHGYAIASTIQQASGDTLRVEEGTLYPLLSKLRREELVMYEWKESDAGPPRKYYRLTEAGKAQLAALDQYWNRINGTIAAMGH